MTSLDTVPALTRIQAILDVLSRARAPMSATQLRLETGMSRSTLYLLLDALKQQRWIEKRFNGYIIGLTLFQLGSTYIRHNQLQALFRQEALAFVAEHSEVVQLAVLDGAQIVYIAREDAPHAVPLVSDLGLRLAAHCSALGKALLASLDDREICALLPAQLMPMTEKSVTRRDVLLQHIAEVRRTGLASEREEVSAGLTCFAAFIGMTPLGARVAISTSVPLTRLSTRREKLIAVGVAGMAHRIGTALRNVST